MKIFLVAMVFSSLVLSSTFLVQTTSAATPASGPVDTSLLSFCNSKCADRCAAAGVKDRCLNYCGICCKECKCVPRGTYGNKDDCPCYRDKKNSKGKGKCP
ncbi:hypothetical protein MKX03_026196 [Papaver bracteatum]|nr:hypothetical protein MKX03_026196 [Papaver bracteatum]